MEKKAIEPAMDLNQQIENLKELGLIINDEDYARRFLNDVSYFRLIKAYNLGLKEKNSKYNGKTTFEEIVQLYLFNSRFRQVLFTRIEIVEVNLRCRLATYFSLKYGPLGYLDANNFVSGLYFDEFKEDMEKEIERNKKSPFVKNFLENYEGGNIPLYALVELFSFGTLSKFFKNMKNEDKRDFAKQYYGVGYTYFESWVENIAFVRNICAHYGRIYNMNMVKTPRLYREYSEKGVSNLRIFATLICIKHLIPNDNKWDEFIQTIDLLIDKYNSVDIKLMGFPDNWKDLLLQ